MNINMLYRQFYDQSGTDLMIGGVETYITNLIKLFIENGHKVFVYQFANKPFKNYYLGATVIGVCPHNKLERMYKNRIRAMIKESYKYSNPEKDILISEITDVILNKLEEFFKIKIEKGIIREVNPKSLAIMCFGMLFQSVILWKVYNHDLDFKTNYYADDLIDLMYEGIKPKV